MFLLDICLFRILLTFEDAEEGLVWFGPCKDRNSSSTLNSTLNFFYFVFFFFYINDRVLWTFKNASRRWHKPHVTMTTRDFYFFLFLKSHAFYFHSPRKTSPIRGVQINLPTDPPSQPSRLNPRTDWLDTSDGLVVGCCPQNPRLAGRSTGLIKKYRKKPIRLYYTGKNRCFPSMEAFRRWFLFDQSRNGLIFVRSGEISSRFSHISSRSNEILSRSGLISSRFSEISAYPAWFGLDHVDFSTIRWISTESVIVLQISTSTKNRLVSDKV